MANKLFIELIERLYKWQNGELQDVLEVNLPGFKKEQLKVQIKNLGVITISGERPADENKRPVRICKKINVSKDCKMDEIHAKLSGENLYITMPKRISIVIPQTQPIQADQQNQENGKPKQNVDKDKLPDAALSMLSKPVKCISRLKSAVLRRQMGGKTAVKIGALAAMVVAAAVGAYVAYKYRQGFHVD